MVKHLEIHDILVDCQHGFRAKRSCETQLISLTQEITNHLHYGIQNDLIILDFSKAFDKVSHKKLLFKLDNYAIVQGWNCMPHCASLSKSFCSVSVGEVPNWSIQNIVIRKEMSL
jgi:hypothetical protein